MNLAGGFDILDELGNYLKGNGEELENAKERAFEKNRWFTREFVDLAITNIANEFLDRDKLTAWTKHYYLDDMVQPKTAGIVMAGNIPLVGFHDFLCAFICGHRQMIKLSSKDDVLLKHLAEKLSGWDPQTKKCILFAETLKGCDAYIATGSNNSARYFDYYFGRYPSIIRRNRTSVAVLSGNETGEELVALADDVHEYFGLGCRNVTKIYVPREYDFVPILNAFRKYNYFSDHTKYRNNYDYNLALLIMNNVKYMTNESVLLVEDENLFSRISQLHYSYYTNADELTALQNDQRVQCIAGSDKVPFGKTQQPTLFSYADGIDTMQFLLSL